MHVEIATSAESASRMRKTTTLPLPHRFAIEMLGVLVAASLAALVIAHLSASPRGWMLFYDGDSVLPLLLQGSLRIGQDQDWVLSSPLFVLETAAYMPILLLDLPPRVSMVLLGLVNWLALYGLFRAVAALLYLPGALRAGSALLAMAGIAALAVCESSADRNALEPASLLTTATYYSGTVIATVAVAGLCAIPFRGGTVRRRTIAALAALVAVSAFSNPLFIGWAVVPLAVAAMVLATQFKMSREAMWVLGALTVGTVLGMLARIPFASILVQDTNAKIQPAWAWDSAAYYLALGQDRLTTVAGWVELLVLAALMLGAALTWTACTRNRWTAGAFVACVATVGPVIVLIGVVCSGTFAARYLQPLAFFPVLALIPACAVLMGPIWNRVREGSRMVRRGIVAGVAAACCVAGVATASISQSIAEEDPSVACVTEWVERSGRTGAGQFWTIRAPKSELRDPRQLVQTDDQLNVYAWLVNQSDFDRTEVSFIVADASSEQFSILGAPSPRATIDCGRYIISDYSPATLQLGEPHH